MLPIFMDDSFVYVLGNVATENEKKTYVIEGNSKLFLLLFIELSFLCT